MSGAGGPEDPNDPTQGRDGGGLPQGPQGHRRQWGRTGPLDGMELQGL